MAMTSDTTVLREAARKAALKTKVGRTLTGEDIRTRAEAAGTTAVSPSAWGGVIRGLANSGLLTPTGDRVRMKASQARGRMSPVYTRNAAARVSA